MTSFNVSSEDNVCHRDDRFCECFPGILVLFSAHMPLQQTAAHLEQCRMQGTPPQLDLRVLNQWVDRKISLIMAPETIKKFRHPECLANCVSLQFLFTLRTRIILGKGSANVRRHYIVMPLLIGWAHTQNDLWRAVQLPTLRPISTVYWPHQRHSIAPWRMSNSNTTYGIIKRAVLNKIHVWLCWWITMYWWLRTKPWYLK